MKLVAIYVWDARFITYDTRILQNGQCRIKLDTSFFMCKIQVLAASMLCLGILVYDVILLHLNNENGVGISCKHEALGVRSTSLSLILQSWPYFGLDLTSLEHRSDNRIHDLHICINFSTALILECL